MFDLRGMGQSHIDGRQSGGGVAQGRTFDHLGLQQHSVHDRVLAAGRTQGVSHTQALASCCWEDLRASSFSTRFIIDDGPVSALSRRTVR
ncbi:hypothetical protein CATMQ487_36490 [Sphaerotilus microaerophilus]|uniref:Uncharacterized protein n=1 Tax=Sphaerotilus microaerophilus TaxID=2914710 RepID=A0ABM7YQ56_9BURK|nr:hypothetical protein CATMQ487_36490 [Sphaerotilus sp. FB-5]